MKKQKKQLLCAVAALMVSASSFGQFFTSTSYRGAFGQGAGANWMSGWTNFDPQNTVYPGNGSGENLAGKTRVDVGAAAPGGDGYTHITSNTTWTSGNVYYLLGSVAVDAGVTLTIQAGTVIRGVDNGGVGSPISVLVISRGATLNAVGTSSNPIVFTSAQPNGSRNSGDWGGLVICGRAQVNLNKSPNLGGRNVEGTVTTAPATASYYGKGNGSTVVNDAESSGNMQYVRVEFAGDAAVAAQELNGIMLAGVGSGTTFQNIQVSYSEDDSFEWFGGTVNGKYLVAFGGVDDDFDVDEGYRGKNQFGFILRDPRFFDGASGANSNFLEMDNNTTSGGNATSDQTGMSPTPATACVFSNITAIGPMRDGDADANVSGRFNAAWNARTNPSVGIFNSIMIGTKGSIAISNTPTITSITTGPSNWQKLSCDSLVLRNSYLGMHTGAAANAVTVGGFAGTTADCQNAFGTKDAATLEAFLENGTNGNIIEKASLTAATLGMASPWFTGTISAVPTQYSFGGGLSFTAVDPTLTVGSPFLSGASFAHPRLDAALPNLTVSSTSTGVFGQYNNVTVSGTGNATLSGDISVTGTLTVQNGGTIVLGTNAIAGTGAISIAAGANVSTAAVGGFANAGNGVTRNSGAKTLSADANYTFNGTAAQNTGGNWTGGRDVTINNAAGVTLSSAATVGGKLNLQAGAFNAGTDLLTINSTATRQGIVDNFTGGYTGTLGSTTSILFKVFGGSSTNNNIGSPLSGSNSITSAIVSAGPTCANTKEFSENLNNWVPVNAPTVCGNTTSFNNLKSFLASGSGSKTYTFSGLPVSTSVNRTITRSAGTVLPAPFVAKGWNALTNPFAAPINWANFDDVANLAQTNCVAYVWNSAVNNYGTISPAGVTTNGANVNIAPGQGILIRKTGITGNGATSGSVTFNPSLRVSSTTRTYVRQAVAGQEIRVELKGLESSDEVMIASGEEAMNVEKFFSPAEGSVSLFIPNGEEGLTTLATELSEKTIPLSIRTEEGAFSLSFNTLKGIKEGYQVVLEDKLNNKFQTIQEGAVYSFYSRGENAARFALHIQQEGLETVANASLVYSTGNQIEVRLQNSNDNNLVQIRDLSGRLVDTFTFGGATLSRSINLPNGVYAVTLSNSGLVKTQKVLFGNN